MANTFSDQDNSGKIIEPFFSRSRQKFKGERNSGQENLEINALIVDINRINNQALSIEDSLENISLNLVSKISDLTEAEILDDGKNFEISNTNILIDDQTSSYGTLEQAMILETLNKISGKIKKVQNKIKRLENGN
jgi:hypothetical protein